MALALLLAASAAGAKEKDEDGPDPDRDPGVDPAIDPFEVGGEDYFFLGVRWRSILIPGFQIRIFVDGGPDLIHVMSVGPELTYRSSKLEVDTAVTYADYSFKEHVFLDKKDPVTDTEIVSSKMKIVYFTVDFLFEVAAEKKGRFSFMLGGGIGLGIVADKLYRAQAYPNTLSDTELERDRWTPCNAPNDPALLNPGTELEYCDDGDDHYGKHVEGSWAKGGDKPNIMPWLSVPQISLRYKPIKQLQVRVDGGWSLTGFFVGMNHAYGF